MRRNVRRLHHSATFVAIATLSLSAPAHAADETKVTLAAGLGLAAASGKTTLGEEAGAIEAGVLGADAFQQAGTVVAAMVNSRASGRTVLVVARDEQVNLAMARVVKTRLEAVQRLLVRAKGNCREPKPNPAKSSSGQFKGLVDTPDGKADFYASDIVAAVATDTAIGAIKLTAEDRLLINAVLANRMAALPAQSVSWTPAGYVLPRSPNQKQEQPTALTVAEKRATFVLAGEATLAGAESEVAKSYRALLTAEDELRSQGCTSAAATAAFSTADELVKSLNTPGDKGGITPLVAAMQADVFASAKHSPLVLRLAIEQTGGTSIARSGILYTLGLPNAATVSSGLVVSFRLLDPATGALTLAGIVRCAVRPQNLKKVAALAGGGTGQTICSYRSG